MNLEQLRAALREKINGLAALKTKAFGTESTDADVEALKSLIKEIKDLEGKIELAEQAEALEAKSSKPADAPVNQPAATVPAVPEQKMEPNQVLSLAAAAVIKAGKGGNALKALEDEGYGQFAKTLGAVNKASVNTLVSGEGGILVPPTLTGGIIPLLRNQSTFLSANPTRVQLVNGQFKQPRGATGATASYVAQGARKPISTPTFDSISMAAKKLAGIVPLTNEAAKWTIGGIESYVRSDLTAACALALDLNAYLGLGTNDAPLGIFKKSGIQTYTGTFASATAPTLAELDTFANAMILKLTTANIFPNDNWHWTMSYRTAGKLATMRVGDNDGELAFPEMQGWASGQARWKGFKVLISNQFPTNGGTGTDETTIGLVDFTHVLFGEESGITVKMSDQAVLIPADAADVGDLISLWQQNMFAILAEMEHDFGLRYAKAVVLSEGIRF